MFYNMYNKNKNPRRGPASSAGKPAQKAASTRHAGARQAQPARFANAGRGRRGAFTGSYIDPKLFVNKAVALQTIEEEKPTNLFSDFAISDFLKQAIAKRGYLHPTDIQDKTIPYILKGHDVVGLANTGTGKTGAFLIPLIDKIIGNPREKVLIVVPTRELALQIQDEFIALTQGLRIHSVVTVGGTNIRPQISRLKSRYNVIIGTPGRLKDLINRKDLILTDFANVVLDEADRMLDMGFIHDVKLLLSLVAHQRQILFFSATLSTEIERLVQDFLKDPVTISIRKQQTSGNVDQDVVKVEKGQDKIEILTTLLAQAHFQKILIFSRTKRGADKLSKILKLKGFKSEAIHGNKSQAQRQRALNMFKNDSTEILVATDVAARGLDIPDVSHVINFDIPATYEDYIHRIGRTGRANKTGSALTFIE